MVDLSKGNDGRHRVYVLRLKNGDLYVGSTAKSIEERAEQHRVGLNAARACKRHGVERVEHRLCLNKCFATREKAQAVERKLAEDLRRKHSVVHQG